MVLGSRGDGGAQQYKLSSKLQATINSVKEIVGAHSDAEILAVLRETNMDANETVQRLLYQDPFHEVKRRRDKKKEIIESKDSSQPKPQLTKIHRPVNQSLRVAGLSRNRSPDSRNGQEFRVVRDNRGNKNANQDLKPEIPHRSILGNGRVGASFREKSSSGHQDSARTQERANVSFKDSNNAKLADESALHTQSTLENTTSVIKGVDSEILVLSGSSSGVYASSSDPVHVPSPDSRSAGIVGAIRREVGVVGGRRHSSERPVSLSSFPNSSFPLPQLGKDISTGADSVGHSKISQQGQTSASDYSVHASRPYSSHQYHNKSQANMEWRPKSSQKSSNGDKLSAPSSSTDQNPTNVEIVTLSDKLSESNIFDSQHVIIPNHLRVPEAERAGLTFGSFGLTFDSSEPSASNTSISVAVGSGEDQADAQARDSQSSSPPSSSQSDGVRLEEMDGSDPVNAANFDEIRLAQSQNASFDGPEPQQMQNPQSLPSFSETYDPHHSYEVPFFASGMDDGVHGQRLSSPAEASSGMAMMQHQAMMYPQVHLSHYPNFMPYRQILSPMYVPPMAIPSYSTSPAYAHPSSASSYLLMPGTASHLKYAPAAAAAASQYKPLSYPADDVSRIKFKDSNPYSPNPQADGSEIWIQSQRDLPGAYYSLSSQTPHAATYLPTAAAPSSHMQFPGMYHHPAQTVTQMTSPHHLMPAAAGGVAAPPPQVGSYQQPQIGHLNWTGNF